MRPLKQIKPTLLINPIVFRKMKELVNKSDKELAWHGFTKRLNNTTYYWYDIILYPQYVTGATVEPDENEYAEWLIKQMSFDNFEDIRLHGHSHVNMACSPSGVDINYRENLLNQVKDYYIFLIINKKGQFTIEIYDIPSGFCYETTDINIVLGTEQMLEEVENWTNKVIAFNVKERSYPCSTTSNPWNFSIQKKLKEQTSMFSDAEPSVDPFQNSWLDSE